MPCQAAAAPAAGADAPIDEPCPLTELSSPRRFPMLLRNQPTRDAGVRQAKSPGASHPATPQLHQIAPLPGYQHAASMVILHIEEEAP